jgi:hypothetical protein
MKGWRITLVPHDDVINIEKAIMVETTLALEAVNIDGNIVRD